MNIENLISKAGKDLEPLSGAERVRMRTLLAEYASFKPAPLAPIRSPFMHRFFMHPALTGACAFALILVTTGGAAYAAESTVPGDLLYPLKVSVTEPVVTALTPSGEAQVTWHVEIAKRRLGEAAALKAAGRLTSTTETTLVAKAADATLEGATLATALPRLQATTTPEATASTTATLIQASKLILEGRGKLQKNDESGAAKAFRASIRAAAGLKALTETAGTLKIEVDDEDDASAATSTPHGTDQDENSGRGDDITATSTDAGASVIDGALRANSRRGEARASTTIRLFGDI